MFSNRIIDGHSHIGKDWSLKIPGKLDEYVNKSTSIGITDSILMSVPAPILGIGQHEVISLVIGHSDEGNYYCTGLKSPDRLIATAPMEHPYEYANILLYQQISRYKNKDMNLHFVPLVHPLFDSPQYVKQLIIFFKPIAIKLHGYASLIAPRDISDEFWKVIEKYNVPLIIHTDADTSGEASEDYFYRVENTPLIWLHILQKYNIRAYLTHGLRLCQDSCRIVNESSNFVVGLGPDGLLSTCKNRLYSAEPYLQTLFSSVDINKICFDLDYPWNTVSYDNTTFDWNSIERIKALGLSEVDLDKVFYQNAKTFYGL